MNLSVRLREIFRTRRWVEEEAARWSAANYPIEQRDIARRTAAVIVDQLGVSPKTMSPRSRFVDDLGAVDLDAVELVIALEEEFDIQLPQSEACSINTVDELIRHIAAKKCLTRR